MDNISNEREKTLVRTSVIGIAANLFLAGTKAVIGVLSNSIAIILDSVNNISDAASSVITIIGAKLAGKEPDKKHPFGHGRVEYMTALVIAAIILYAGITSLIESVKKIINPEMPDYSPVTLLIILMAVLVKVILGLYVRKKGREIKAETLVNSGTDALMDSVVSAATLLAAIIYIVFRVSVEAWLGAVISLVIMKAGVDMVQETVSKLLGEPGDIELVKEIKKEIGSFPEVRGVFDLILNDYGPDTYTGSVHIEVEDSMSMRELDILTRNITDRVFDKQGVYLTGISIYSINSSEHITAIRQNITSIALQNKFVRQIHGFFIDEEKKEIKFDCVVSFDAGSRKTVVEDVRSRVRREFPDYNIVILLDTDYNEL